MVKIVGEIPSFGKVMVEIDKDISKREIKRILCEKFGIEEKFTFMKKKSYIDKNDFNELKENIGTVVKTKPITQGHEKRKDIEISRYELDYLWARQLLIYGDSFKKIRRAKVLIVGAGALGNELTKNLALSGIGEITIVDPDKIENSNLSRTVFFNEEDIGKYKVEVLAKKVKNLIPSCEIYPYCCVIQDQSSFDYSKFLTYDLIASCVDNAEARFFLTKMSILFGIPLFDSAIGGSRYDSSNGNYVKIQNLITHKDPCIACPMNQKQYERQKRIRNSCGEIEKDPSNLTLNSIAASIQAEEILKYLSGKEKILSYLLIDTSFNRYTLSNFKKNSNCIICSTTKPLEKIKVKKIEDIRKDFPDCKVTFGESNKFLVLLKDKSNKYKNVILEVTS